MSSSAISVDRINKSFGKTGPGFGEYDVRCAEGQGHGVIGAKWVG